MLEDLKLNVQLKLSQTPLGRTLKAYKCGRLIGTGGFSKVYEAVCCQTGVKVAIKLIEKSIITDQLRIRIRHEIDIQSQVFHSSLLKLFTAFEDDNYVCLVLEYCLEGDLAKYIERKGVSEKDVKGIVKQVVSGLQYLHSQNIVHRDIKLANILLTESKDVKIADFGLSTRVRPGEPHMTLCGTPNYISPEIVNHKNHGLEADLWSLGCLLYTLLVGKPPFETDSPGNTMNKIRSGNFFMPPCLPQTAQDLINGLLQKNPNYRLSLKEVQNHAFLSDENIPYQKWSLSGVDSGVDTHSSSSNYLSSKYLSLDRKKLSNNYSNGYSSFERSKSGRRSRSQDRKSPSVGIDPVFFVDHIEKNGPGSTNSFKTKNEIDSYQLSEDIIKCNMFCENEVLNQKNCDCWKCKSKIDKFEDLRSSPKFGSVKRAVIHKSTAQPPSDTDCSDERVIVTPFNTKRLKPKREELKNVILSILDCGDVCMERIKCKSNLKNQQDVKLVVEVVRISKNGMKMYLYYPNKGLGVPVDSRPPPLPLNGADAVFNCDILSKENWKKYQKVAQFVEMVKSKTPKLTLYTKKSKCLLMENAPDPDFQIIYYDDKKKITKSRKGVLLDHNGNEYLLNLDQPGSNDSRFIEHCLYFQECFKKCRIIEEQLASISLSTADKEFKIFPAILGKKPTDRKACSSDSWDDCLGSPKMFHSTKYEL